MGLIDKAEKKIRKKVLGEVEDWFEDRFDDVTDVFDDIESQVKEALSLGKEAQNRINYLRSKGIADRAKKAVVDLGDEIIAEFQSKITDEMLEGLADALDDAADIIETLAPDSFTLIYGAEVALVVQCEITVSVEIPNPVAKLTEIRGWADKPPKGRAQIMDCIRDFGPETIGIEAKVSGNGVAASWSGDSKYDRIDAFLEKHGVK